MLASLPMYDRPELIDAHDRYWLAVRRELGEIGIASPATLTRGVGDLLDHWRSSDLLLSQTCGMPYRRELHDDVTLVGTPDFGVQGCPPGYYRSVFIVRSDDVRASLDQFATGRFAFNDAMSQSGFNAPRVHVEQLGFGFTELAETGSHMASATMVANGGADIASLDAVTWRFMQNHDRVAAMLRTLDLTAPTPGLPYISSSEMDGELVFGAVERAIDCLAASDRQRLGIKGLVLIPSADYLAVPSPVG